MTQCGNHKMGKNALNHGNSQCEYCGGTDLEIVYALGTICPKAPDTQVFKIQRPLAAMDTMNKILIYNEDRSVIGEVPVTQDWLDAYFPEGSMKIYVDGFVDAAGVVHFEVTTILPEKRWPSW